MGIFLTRWPGRVRSKTTSCRVGWPDPDRSIYYSTLFIIFWDCWQSFSIEVIVLISDLDFLSKNFLALGWERSNINILFTSLVLNNIPFLSNSIFTAHDVKRSHLLYINWFFRKVINNFIGAFVGHKLFKVFNEASDLNEEDRLENKPSGSSSFTSESSRDFT